MTDRTAGEIIEKVYLSGKATAPQLKQVRHSLSYSYYKNRFFILPSDKLYILESKPPSEDDLIA